MSASWRVYKSPPGWSTADADRPWTVMQRVYTVYDEFGKREWVTHSVHPSWDDAINTVVAVQLETIMDTSI